MGYELEYKKVHNTLGTRNKNKYNDKIGGYIDPINASISEDNLDIFQWASENSGLNLRYIPVATPTKKWWSNPTSNISLISESKTIDGMTYCAYNNESEGYQRTSIKDFYDILFSKHITTQNTPSEENALCTSLALEPDTEYNIAILNREVQENPVIITQLMALSFTSQTPDCYYTEESWKQVITNNQNYLHIKTPSSKIISFTYLDDFQQTQTINADFKVFYLIIYISGTATSMPETITVNGQSYQVRQKDVDQYNTKVFAWESTHCYDINENCQLSGYNNNHTTIIYNFSGTSSTINNISQAQNFLDSNPLTFTATSDGYAIANDMSTDEWNDLFKFAELQGARVVLLPIREHSDNYITRTYKKNGASYTVENKKYGILRTISRTRVSTADSLTTGWRGPDGVSYTFPAYKITKDNYSTLKIELPYSDDSKLDINLFYSDKTKSGLHTNYTLKSENYSHVLQVCQECGYQYQEPTKTVIHFALALQTKKTYESGKEQWINYLLTEIPSTFDESNLFKLTRKHTCPHP